MSLRYDVCKIVESRKDYRFTEEGFLLVTAIATRTGVFNYRNADGSLRRELRHPDNVFLADSLSSIKMIPVTNDHPAELVNRDNVKKYSVGNVGEIITVDGKFIRVSLTIQDRTAIDAITNGKDELSLGYQITPIEEAGEYDGINYDVRQTEIVYNHLAIVDVARAGHDARIKLDSGDAVLTDEETKKDSKKTINKKGPKMAVYKIDGIDYETAQEVINHVAKCEAKTDFLKAEVKAAKADSAKFQAERDATKEKLDKAEKAATPEAIRKCIDTRLLLERGASKVLGDSVDFSKLDDAAIKTEVLKKTNPDTNFDGKSVEYIDARFEIAVEDSGNDNSGSVGGQLNTINKGTNFDKKDDNVSSRQKMFDRMQRRSCGEKE